MDSHPLLGRVVFQDDNHKRSIYTRTVVLWAVGVVVDADKLDRRHLSCVQVSLFFCRHCCRFAFGDGGDTSEEIRVSDFPKNDLTPSVRMLSSSTCRRGCLKKRLRKRPFRSVLSLPTSALSVVET